MEKQKAPLFFSKPAEFRKWLEKNQEKETELLIGFYKIATGKPSMTWSESVDQALCYGWIDGVRKSIDEESYSIRFTPRKKGSIWSNVNIKKVEELTKKELMQPKGIEAFKLRTAEKSGIYSFENEAKDLGTAFEKQFKVNANAWEFFNKQAPSYRKTIIGWIVSAKQEATRLSRLQKTIEACEKGKRL